MRKFLTATWQDLIMANYEVDPALLVNSLPNGTELDFHEGRCFISLVGFMFLDTRVLGIPIPFHINFEEVNLRFYVTRKTEASMSPTFKPVLARAKARFADTVDFPTPPLPLAMGTMYFTLGRSFSFAPCATPCTGGGIVTIQSARFRYARDFLLCGGVRRGRCCEKDRPRTRNVHSLQ